MTLLLGTEDGVYRASGIQFDDAARVLDAGRVMRVRQFEESDRVYACTRVGLHRSTDGGETWSGLGVPREEVYSVRVSPDGERLYAGTHPAHLYMSEDDGDSWHELEGFQELPSRGEWYTPRHRNEAHIRSLDTHPDAPSRVIAGVEVGGVHVSDDAGETWTERRDGLHDDVHHVLVRSPVEYIASCGDGLYGTADAGHTWTRLDEKPDHRYFREAIAHNGHLYVAAARSPPGTWKGESGADAALFVSTDAGETFDAPPYPGKPREVILAWAVANGRVVAGTDAGRLLAEGGGGWETVGRVDHGIRSIRAV